jgi:hypothetical protein
VFRYISKDAVPSKSDLVNLENELTWFAQLILFYLH